MLTEADLAGMRETFGGVLTQTCTRERFAGSTDAEGNFIGGVKSTATYPCKLVRTEETERVEGRDLQISDWILRLPHDADVTGRDQIVVDGTRYQVVGPPVVEATGFDIGLSARLELVA